VAIDPASDPFTEGHEDRTPPELYAVRPGDGAPDTPGWTVRVVPNLYPALDPQSPDPPPQANPDLFWAGPARGAHEVIVNAPDPVLSLSQLRVAQVVDAVEVWRARMRVHADSAYVHVIVNELGDLVAQEVRLRERIVAIDDEAVLMAAYGGRVPYQLMLAPRSPRLRFEDDGPTGAAMLHEALSRLARHLGASPPLNLWVRTAPRGAEHFCWRIDILPRLTHLAGLELGAGVNLNIVAPERAAADLRDA
jgi:UDPglucose--hexose-1-phosphate uridylyltransferase